MSHVTSLSVWIYSICQLDLFFFFFSSFFFSKKHKTKYQSSFMICHCETAARTKPPPPSWERCTCILTCSSPSILEDRASQQITTLPVNAAHMHCVINVLSSGQAGRQKQAKVRSRPRFYSFVRMLFVRLRASAVQQILVWTFSTHCFWHVPAV